ncbi:hypothetical protein DIPPA_33397 [Diplonema papillatum]|nr:hypothetical protein DIPPA_33397 [Diplonema papillatum]
MSDIPALLSDGSGPDDVLSELRKGLAKCSVSRTLVSTEATKVQKHMKTMKALKERHRKLVVALKHIEKAEGRTSKQVALEEQVHLELRMRLIHAKLEYELFSAHAKQLNNAVSELHQSGVAQSKQLKTEIANGDRLRLQASEQEQKEAEDRREIEALKQRVAAEEAALADTRRKAAELKEALAKQHRELEGLVAAHEAERTYFDSLRSGVSIALCQSSDRCSTGVVGAPRRPDAYSTHDEI